MSIKPLKANDKAAGMLTDLPLVTVIAGCYNHEKFVVECLEGIRRQTYPNIQLIIMDDCSKDSSVEIITDWIKTHQVKCSFIFHQENFGFPKTLNQALRIAEGKYIAIISTDDVWMPGFIEDRLNILDKDDESVGLVYGKSLKIDEYGNLMPGLFQECRETPEGYVLEKLFKHNFIAANSVLIRKSCYDKIGRYDENLTLEDYDMWVRIGREYKFAYSNNIFSKYRVLRDSLGHSNRGKMGDNVSRILLRSLETNPEYKKTIIERLIPLRNIVYHFGHPITPMIYRKALEKRFRKKDLFLLVFSQLRIPYRVSKRFVDYAERHSRIK